MSNLIWHSNIRTGFEVFGVEIVLATLHDDKGRNYNGLEYIRNVSSTYYLSKGNV